MVMSMSSQLHSVAWAAVSQAERHRAQQKQTKKQKQMARKRKTAANQGSLTLGASLVQMPGPGEIFFRVRDSCRLNENVRPGSSVHQWTWDSSACQMCTETSHRGLSTASDPHVCDSLTGASAGVSARTKTLQLQETFREKTGIAGTPPHKRPIFCIQVSQAWPTCGLEGFALQTVSAAWGTSCHMGASSYLRCSSTWKPDLQQRMRRPCKDLKALLGLGAHGCMSERLRCGRASFLSIRSSCQNRSTEASTGESAVRTRELQVESRAAWSTGQA